MRGPRFSGSIRPSPIKLDFSVAYNRQPGGWNDESLPQGISPCHGQDLDAMDSLVDCLVSAARNLRVGQADRRVISSAATAVAHIDVMRQGRILKLGPRRTWRLNGTEEIATGITWPGIIDAYGAMDLDAMR